MRLVVVIALVLGLGVFAGIDLATAAARQPDVDEAHTLVDATNLEPLVVAGSRVLIECQLPDGAGYLAVGSSLGITVLVFTVTAAQLDSVPRGPFEESCAHWQKRHHVMSTT